jgi:hypothetical protein
MSTRVRIAAVVFSLVAAAATLHADWTVVASTGTVDEADLGKIVLNNDGSASIRSTISSTSAKIRFNVTENPFLMPPQPGTEAGGLIFAMRVRDNGAGARVFATLKRIEFGFDSDALPQASGIAATIDSDLAPPSTGWINVFAQHYSTSCCFTFNPRSGGREGMRFGNGGWVAEVQLIKHDSTGTPAVIGVSVFREQP